MSSPENVFCTTVLWQRTFIKMVAFLRNVFHLFCWLHNSMCSFIVYCLLWKYTTKNTLKINKTLFEKCVLLKIEVNRYEKVRLKGFRSAKPTGQHYSIHLRGILKWEKWLTQNYQCIINTAIILLRCNTLLPSFSFASALPTNSYK